MRTVDVLALDELTPERGRLVRAGRCDIALFRRGDQVFAIAAQDARPLEQRVSTVPPSDTRLLAQIVISRQRCPSVCDALIEALFDWLIPLHGTA